MLRAIDHCGEIIQPQVFYNDTDGFGFRFNTFIRSSECYSLTIGFNGYANQELRDADLLRWYLAVQHPIVAEA